MFSLKGGTVSGYSHLSDGYKLAGVYSEYYCLWFEVVDLNFLYLGRKILIFCGTSGGKYFT